ncbi:MAG: ABC transporter substrate-binding protein [Butyricicoccaceae bacterium]
MKKFTAAMLTMALAGTMLTGCGSTASNTTTDDSAAKDNTAATDTAAEFKLATDGKLTMATNAYFEPWEYYDGENIVGIDPEVAQAIADKLGLELEIMDMDFDSIVTAVSAGKADMGMAGMTVTEERQKNVDFSQTYAQARFRPSSFRTAPTSRPRTTWKARRLALCRALPATSPAPSSSARTQLSASIRALRQSWL